MKGKCVLINLVGQKFGKWTVLNRAPDLSGKTMWFCRCDCGTEKSVNAITLRKGISMSCGCLFPAHNTKHGLNRHPLYRIWKGMKARCLNPNNSRYHRYGGRGVTVCTEWENDFKSFYNWAMNNGYKSGLQLDKDKIPKMLGQPAIIYSPKTCCFITQKENTRYNSRVKLDLKKVEEIRKSSKSNRELATEYNVHIDSIGLIKRNKTWV